MERVSKRGAKGGREGANADASHPVIPAEAIARPRGRAEPGTSRDRNDTPRGSGSRVSPRSGSPGMTTAALPRRRPARGTRVAGAYKKTTIALVYDFDGTLSPKPMQEYAFLPKLGVKAKDFWAECSRIAQAERADPLITYMRLMYQKAKAKGLRIDRADLVAQGQHVELFPGVEEWFDAIAAYAEARGAGSGVTVKHYLVSSGLTEIIEGTRIAKHFARVFASEYWFDAYDLPFPKRVITDTGKTQYLFRINKGREDYNETINSHMPEDERPIPFSNMIYFGDGETDVPSMALLKKNGGSAIAVHAPKGKPDKCVELFKAGRCDFYAGADYREGSALWRRTCLLIDRIVADVRVKEEGAGLVE